MLKFKLIYAKKTVPWLTHSQFDYTHSGVTRLSGAWIDFLSPGRQTGNNSFLFGHRFALYPGPARTSNREE